MIFQVLAGDAEFVESQHPRDKDGKFATSAGGGSTAIPEGKTPVATPINKVLGAHGFKKLSGWKAGKNTAFIHPSGVKVVIHPIPGVVRSNKWTVKGKAGEEHGTGSGTSLEKLLSKVLNQTAFVGGKPASEKPAALEGAFGHLIGSGFFLTSSPGAETKVLKKGDLEVSLNEGAGTWTASQPGKSPVTGNSMASLKNQMAQGLPPSPTAVAEHSEAIGVVKEKGYSFVGSNGAKVVFEKGTDKIEFDVDTGEWVAQSTGHMTKEGTGAKNLAKLLSGNPITYYKSAVSPELPWKNSSKSITMPPKPKTPAQLQAEAEAKAKAEADQAKQAAMAKARADKEKKEKETMQKLISIAPEPTSAQKQSISSYTGSGYSGLNKSLRQSDEDVINSSMVKNLDAYLSQAEIPEDVVLYRGVKGDYAQIIRSVVMEGTKFVDLGYISTTTRESMADGWASGLVMKMIVKKGTKGAAVKHMSNHPGEDEVVLMRGSALVVKTFDRKKGYLEVEVDQGHFK